MCYKFGQIYLFLTVRTDELLVTSDVSAFVTRNVSGIILLPLRSGYEPDTLVTGDQTNEVFRSV